MKSHDPKMNITNQINAGLNDVRASLIDLSCVPRYGTDQADAIMKAKYQLDLIVTMIQEHKQGIYTAWSDRKYMVDEEFSK